MRTAVLTALLVLVASVCEAIVIRHDRDPAAYLRNRADYPMACEVAGGMGTLIGPVWVLTAAHVADGMSKSAPAVRFGGRPIGVDAVYIHPDFGDPEKHRDIALLRLAEPVTGVTPALLYRDGDEVGRRVTFVGSGLTGTGLNGPVRGERVFRAARNTVESAADGWLTFVFDAPPAGDDLEGISGPGDSGGPALITVEGRLYVAGVSAYNDGEIECVYGTTEYYCRVSDVLDWIDGVLSGAVAGTAKPPIRQMRVGPDGKASVSRSEPESVEVPVAEDRRTWRVVAALAESLAEPSPERYMTLFSARYIRRAPDAGEQLRAIFDFMKQVREIRGPIAVFHPLDRKAFRVPESAYPMRTIIFHLQDKTPGYLGIALDDDGKIDFLSLFVREGICPDGADCTAGRELGEFL